MKRLFYLIVFIAITLNANTVSNLKGELSVKQGALNYSVPLNLPAGAAGVKPQVSLNYNSNGGNGYLGLGWGITGQSTIVRCGSNLAFDGKIRGVRYDKEDNICLNGQRLVLVSGDKWEEDSEYRIKIDTYSKIKYENSEFTVYEKNGDIKTYTLYDQSWLLSTVKDRFDNAITYNYHTDENAAEIYLDNISYADNDIVFNYEDRLDKRNYYVNGNKKSFTQRVNSIDIKSGGNTLRTYDLTYKEQTSAIDKLILANIQKCSDDECLEPIEFEFKPNSKKFETVNLIPSSAIKSDRKHIFADMDKDGLIDIVEFEEGNIYIIYNKGDENFQTKNVISNKTLDIPHSKYASIINKISTEYLTSIADINGDGLPDLVGFNAKRLTNNSTYNNGEDGLIVSYNKGNGQFETVNLIPSSAIKSDRKHIFADMDKDGLIDIVEFEEGNIYIIYNKGDENFQTKNVISNKTLDIPHSKYASIINKISTEYLTSIADINGDGLPDLVGFNAKRLTNNSTYNNGEDGLIVSYNKGNGQFETVNLIPSSAIKSDRKHIFADMDKDGLIDIVEFEEGNIYIIYNKGDENFQTKNVISNKTLDIPHSKYASIINKISTEYLTSITDINGDGLPDLVGFNAKRLTNNSTYNNGEDGLIVSYNKGNQHSNMIKVIDSFKNETVITYKPLIDTNIYTKDNNATFPIVDTYLSKKVVESVSLLASNDTISTISYKYKGLKVNLEGLGSLGFRKIIADNNTSDISISTTYHQEYPYIGLPDNKSTKIDNQLVSISSFAYDSEVNGNITQLYVTNKTLSTYENGDPLKTETVTIIGFDDFGNAIDIIKTVTDERSEDVSTSTAKIFTTLTKNEYKNNISRWIIGRLEDSEVTYSVSGVPDITKKSSFTYYPDTGILHTETIEPDNTEKWLKKEYFYDTYGNINKEIITGADIKSRTREIFYDSQGKFITKTKNALGYTESENRIYNADGQLKSITDSNGLTTTWQYDNFCKKTKEIRTDGTSTSYIYEFDNSVNNSYYKITVTNDGSSPIVTYYNSIGQKVRVEKTGFDGTKIYEDFYYDDFGNINKKSTPYFAGQTPDFIHTAYDKYQRVKEIKAPAPLNTDAIQTIEYDGFKTIVTNAENQIKTTTKNALGKITKVEEEEGAFETYEYYADGKLHKTIDSENNTIELKYDILGNKIYQNDPDMGIWKYEYNALSLLVKQTDAKGQITTIKYDLLGRKKEEDIAGTISTWIYDTKHKGKLTKEEKPNFQKEYSYDELGRVKDIVTAIDGQPYTKSYTYDINGRVDTKTLPNDFKVKNTYNSHGYLKSIKSPKEQIKDFDSEHFTSLIEKTLNSSVELYKKALEYQAEANRLYRNVSYYRRIADIYSNYQEQLLATATRLEVYAKQYQKYADNYKARSDNYKKAADYYLSLSDRYKKYWWGYRYSQYYKRLSIIYNNYSSNLAYWSNYYLNISTSLQDRADWYENYANGTIEDTKEYYIELANDTLAKAKVVQDIANKLKNQSNSYEKDDSITTAYEQISEDSDYNYFYKVLKQDSFNRVTSYISGNGLITTKDYDDSGVLNSIKTGYDFDDKVRDLTFEYDKLANVTNRVDNKLNITQNYTYDNLNRVTDVYIDTIFNSSTISYKYDSIGNMTHKSDIGYYTYNPDKPHQVTGAGIKSFIYDKNGNMTNNNGTTIDYTAYNKPSQITTTDDTINFYYDTNKNRYRKSTEKYTSYYIDKSYEKIYYNSGIQEEKYFIYANGKVVSIYTNKHDINRYGTFYNIDYSTKYLHYDSLNSVDTITNNIGVVEQRMAYKPFGEKINVDNYGKSTSKKSSITNRGYTGHEHIQETDLIHMNGRVYDPTIGRFLSADPHIPYPLMTQSFNRYSYARNNPLKYIDPSGFVDEDGMDESDETDEWGNEIGSEAYDSGQQGDLGSGGNGTNSSGGMDNDGTDDYYGGNSIEDISESNENNRWTQDDTKRANANALAMERAFGDPEKHPGARLQNSIEGAVKGAISGFVSGGRKGAAVGAAKGAVKGFTKDYQENYEDDIKDSMKIY